MNAPETFAALHDGPAPLLLPDAWDAAVRDGSALPPGIPYPELQDVVKSDR